jgi:hypothetical protein
VVVLLERWIERQHAVRTNTEPTPAEPPRQTGQLVIREVKKPIINDNEIVSGTIHFRKLDYESRRWYVHPQLLRWLHLNFHEDTGTPTGYCRMNFH